MGQHEPPLAVPVSAQLDPMAIVTSDLNCRRCGYNLRGLTYGGRCPECNVPVAMSAQSDALRYGDPRWLRRLCIGCEMLMAQKLLYIAWSAISLFRIPAMRLTGRF